MSHPNINIPPKFIAASHAGGIDQKRSLINEGPDLTPSQEIKTFTKNGQGIDLSNRYSNANDFKGALDAFLNQQGYPSLVMAYNIPHNYPDGLKGSVCFLIKKLEDYQSSKIVDLNGLLKEAYEVSELLEYGADHVSTLQNLKQIKTEEFDTSIGKIAIGGIGDDIHLTCFFGNETELR